MITFRMMTTDSIFSKLIRQITWSPYSHVDICVPEGLLGAKTDGVKIRSYEDEVASDCEYLGFDGLTKEQEGYVYKFYYDQIGKPYDFGQIIGILSHHDWSDTSKWFCSELAYAGLSFNGFPLFREEELDRVSPGLLMLSPYLKAVTAPERNLEAETACRHALTCSVCQG